MKLPPIYAHPDLAAVRALLAAAGLPTADLTATPRADFWGCGTEEDLAGVIGLETYDSVALLRSLAVAPAWRERGLGTTLLAHAEQVARQGGGNTLYLLTTSAAAFFARHGYTRLPREAVPPVLHGTAEFTTLCPASAVCMAKRLAVTTSEAPPGCDVDS